jgi:transcriptional regulator with GAF, ATPase, and Fis domain
MSHANDSHPNSGDTSTHDDTRDDVDAGHRADALHRAYHRLATMVLGDRKMEDVLGEILHTATELIPAAASASVTLVEGDRGHTAAHLGELALQLDERQYERGHGPCLECGLSGSELHIRDMEHETRWPDYTPVAAAAGAAWSVSVPLPIQERVVGALNLYGTVRGTFPEGALDLARAVSAVAAAAVVNTTVLHSSQAMAMQMQEAMASRAVIEQAKGLLMGQRRCDADEAFDILRRLSQDTNRKLRDVAKALIDTAAPGGAETNS